MADYEPPKDHPEDAELEDPPLSPPTDNTPQSPSPDWRSRCFTPKICLLLLTAINLLNYADRYIVSGVLDDIEHEVTAGAVVDDGGCDITVDGTTTHYDRCLTGTQQGLVGSVFMIGFMIGSPLFAVLVKWVSSAKLLCFTLILWCGAVVLGASTDNYYILLTARAMSGFGEAAFGCIAPPFINKIAPPASKGTWLSVYFCAVPVGSALGFGAGGWASSQGIWRLPFFVEAIMMAPLALLCFFAPIGRRSEKKATRAAHKLARVSEPWWRGLLAHLVLFTNKRYMLMVMGYAAISWCMGGLTYWAIDFITHTGIESDKTSASFVTGAVTALAGLIGTAFGGVMLDRRTADRDLNYWGYLQAAKLNYLFVLLAIPPLVLATELTSPVSFYFTLLVAMTLLLCTTTIANSGLMWCAEPGMQEFAMAMSTVIIHLFGDVPSNVVMGAVRDATGGRTDPRAWRWMFYSAEVALIPCAVLWIIAAVVGQRCIDQREPVGKLEIFEDLLSSGEEHGSMEHSPSLCSLDGADDDEDTEKTRMRTLSKADGYANS